MHFYWNFACSVHSYFLFGRLACSYLLTRSRSYIPNVRLYRSTNHIVCFSVCSQVSSYFGSSTLVILSFIHSLNSLHLHINCTLSFILCVYRYCCVLSSSPEICIVILFVCLLQMLVLLSFTSSSFTYLHRCRCIVLS